MVIAVFQMFIYNALYDGSDMRFESYRALYGKVYLFTNAERGEAR